MLSVIWAVSPTGQRPTSLAPTNQPIKWTESFSNQSHGSSLGITTALSISRPLHCNESGGQFAQLFTELWRRKERLFVPHFYVVHKKVILFLRMTKRWRTFYPKVSVRAAKEAHKEKMIAFHSTKSGKQVCLQLNPRTSLVSFIWSFFASNPQTISQKWNKSQMLKWHAKKLVL